MDLEPSNPSVGVSSSSSKLQAPKRQGSGSEVIDFLRSVKRLRCETTSEENVPSGPTLHSGTQINGGTFTDIGRDQYITIHNHHPGPVQLDVMEILRSLSLPNFRKIQLDTLAKATEGTCVWLTEGQIFRIWIENGKILWGTGIPGAGKTILAAIVINALEKFEKEKPHFCVAYVYIRYSASLTIQEILQSLVLQIVERHDDVSPLVASLYAKHRHERTAPSHQELLALLSDIIRMGKRLHLVLDALDELSAGDRRVLVELLASLDARLFITSRPLQPVERHFRQAQFFNIAAAPPDIVLLIKDAIRRYPEVLELIEDFNMEDEVIKTVSQKAGGMFLHAKLQLEALRNCLNIQDLEETLETFPADLHTVYMQTWERIMKQSSKHADLAKLIFLWVMHSGKELTLHEIRHCVATSPESYAYEPKRLVPEALLLSVCCGLVSVDEETQLVRLIHYTVKDTIQPLILQTFPNPQGLLLRVCLKHLRSCSFHHSPPDNYSDLHSSFWRDPLLGYAYESWHVHAHRVLQRASTECPVNQFVLAFERYAVSVDWRTYDYLGPLHICAYYGLEPLIRRVAQVHHPMGRTPNRGLSPLHLACITGQLETIRTILTLPGVDANARDTEGTTPLMHAAQYGQTQAAEILLSLPQVDVNAVNQAGQTAIMVGSTFGRTETVQALVRGSGFDINAVDDSGRNALMLASDTMIGSDTETVRVLLTVPGIDVNAKDKDGSTALMRAAATGRRKTIRLFLAMPGIDVNAVDAEGRTALMRAAPTGWNSETVQILLDAPQVDACAVDNMGRDALMVAAGEGPAETVEVLLASASGLDLNRVDHKGWNALLHATKRRDPESLQALLAHPGVDVNVVDHEGWTPLMTAATWETYGAARKVKILLDVPGINMHAVNKDGDTMFSLAGKEGREDVAKVLREFVARSEAMEV